MSAVEYTLNAKRELLGTAGAGHLPCCRQSFLVGLFQGPRIGPFVKTRRSLRRLAGKYLRTVFSAEGAILIDGSRLLVPGVDQLVLREKFVERIGRTSDTESGKHCILAFLQGLFVSCGYIQHPGRGYHLEFRIGGRWLAAAFRKATNLLRVRFGHYKNGQHICFYMKSGRRIIKFLNLLGLFDKALEFADLRATRSILSMVNRQVNFETANINRLIDAAEQSIAHIKELLEFEDQEIWTESLHQMAQMRMKFPHDSIENLGRRFEPPLTKSAVNHRLRRIKALHTRIFKGNETVQLS